MEQTAKGYALPNAWDLSKQRLELLEACHDPSSFARAAVLGVGPGWRCLEAGAGNGSFARWLAERVGDRGGVVAADIDTRLLEDLDALPHVEVRRIELVEDELERAEFDFVHTRMLLLHLPERDELLAKLALAVRPGGLLMVEEDDCYPLSAATGPYREAWEAFMEMMRDAGLDAEWARALPERLDALGLAGVDAELVGQLFRGGSDPARFWAMTWLQARDRIAALGLGAEHVDAGRAVLEDPARWSHGPVKVIAWGRRM